MHFGHQKPLMCCSTALFTFHAGHRLPDLYSLPGWCAQLMVSAAAMHAPRADLKGCPEDPIVHMVVLTTVHQQSLGSPCATRCGHAGHQQCSQAERRQVSHGAGQATPRSPSQTSRDVAKISPCLTRVGCHYRQQCSVTMEYFQASLCSFEATP